MAEGDTIQVFTDDILGFGLASPEPLPEAPKPCQLVPPCREGNHGIQPSIDAANRKIGKYYFTEEALKHDLAALKRGKVYTKQEFYRRARAWYKAEIDRILHWHRVYKERKSDKPKEITDPKAKSEAIEETITKSELEETLKVETQLGQDGSKEKENRKEGQQEETEPSIQDPKPKSRAKKVKVPTAPTRVQPARAAKRKATEPPRPTRRARKKNKIEDTIEAAAPTPEPEEAVDVEAEEPAKERAEDPRSGEQQPNGSQGQPKPQEQVELQKSDPNQPQQEPLEETKGDYQLNLEEWKVFLARYNSATTPVTPTPSPTSLSAYTLRDLQGLDVANFLLRLERIVETRINGIIDERRGITIDAGAGGGLCLTGYYHHPYKCALDGNYVPPLKFEAAGGYVPGEDWRPEQAEKQDEADRGKVGDLGERSEDKKGQREEMVKSTVGVVSSPKYRPPGTGRRLADRLVGSANTSRGGSPVPTRQRISASDPASTSIPGLEAALLRQAKAAEEGHQNGDKDSAPAGSTDYDEPLGSSQLPQTRPNLPQPPILPSGEESNVPRSTSMRNSSAPEAVMEISPTLGRWRPFMPGLPLENFDDAIVDAAGLRFAIDLCAGYLGDGRSARVFML